MVYHKSSDSSSTKVLGLLGAFGSDSSFKKIQASVIKDLFQLGRIVGLFKPKYESGNTVATLSPSPVRSITIR